MPISNELIIQVLHTSDLHGKFRNYEYAIDRPTSNGGLSALASVIKKLRQQYPLTLLVDTGDAMQDNNNEIFIPAPSTNPMVLAMNALHYDCWTIGNHEFNFGMPYLSSITKELHFPTLGGNIYHKNGQPLLPSYHIVNRGGVRIAIIGLVTPNIARWDSEHLANYTVEMPLTSMSKLWPELKDRADLYIFACHLSLEDEYQSGDGYRLLLEHYQSFKLALAAHAHDVLNTCVENIAIIEPGGFGAFLGQALITMTKKGGKFTTTNIEANLISMKNMPDDPAILSLTAKAHRQALDNAHTVIGTLEGGALAPPNKIRFIAQSQLESTALTAFINEMQMHYTGAAVAATALFRGDANLFPGPITKAGVSLIYKYDNTLRSYKMNGAQLKCYIEWSARYFNRFKPGDLTISFNPAIRIYNFDVFSGVQYQIDLSEEVGNRVKNLRWPTNKPVKESDSFIIAVNDYRGKGTFMQDIFPDGTVSLYEDLYDRFGDESRIRLLIARYIKEVKQGKLTNSFNPNIHNFTLTGFYWDEALRAKMVNLINKSVVKLPASNDGRTLNIRSLTVNDLP